MAIIEYKLFPQRHLARLWYFHEPPLPMGEIGKVIFSLNPLNQFECCWDIVGSQGQYKLQKNSKLRHCNGRRFFSPTEF